MGRVRIITNCVADHYANRRDGERIVEFHDDQLDAGGLISFRRTPEGKLSVYVYRAENVEVAAPESVLVKPIGGANEMLELLTEAIPYVEESEQFNKPTRRTLSKRMRALAAPKGGAA